MAKKASSNGTPKRRGRPPKAAQAVIAEMEPVFIDAIDEAAAEYVEVRDQRMELADDEAKKHQRLLDLMHEHKQKKYQTRHGETVEIVKTEAEKAKVKKPKIDEDD